MPASPPGTCGRLPGRDRSLTYDARVLVALVCALATTFAYGVSTVLQAIGARRVEESDGGVDPSLLVRLASQGPFLAGIALDIAAVGFTIVALRRLDLFVVQSAIAASLAVTAVVSARVFHAKLGRNEWLAIGAVGAGLVMLALSAGPEAPPSTSSASRFILVAAIAVVVLLAIPAGRLTRVRAATALGALAGVAYGTANTALRVIQDFSPGHLVTNVAAYVAVAGAILGILLFATGLQRGSVTAATAAMVVAETILPSIYGAVVLDERPRSGWVGVAVVGFIATIGAAVTLSRFGEGTA